MGVWWPLLQTYLCAVQSPRGRVHAVRRDGVGLREWNGTQWLRTECGLDAQLLAHRIVGRDNDVIVAHWPAPKIDRCTDCAEVTGVRGRQVAGSSSFQDLIT